MSEPFKVPTTLVCGPPGSGKTTYVRERVQYGDLIIDLDDLFGAISGQQRHIHPEQLLSNAFAARDALENTLVSDSAIGHAWIIRGAPQKFVRDAMAERGAEIVVLAVPKEQCLENIAADSEREGLDNPWEEWIDKWWQEYSASKNQDSEGQAKLTKRPTSRSQENTMNNNKKFWTIRAAKEPKTGEVLLYGNIGPDDGFGWLFDEVSPKTFREELDALGDISELRLFINSDGGDVFAGQAIHTILKRHTAKVTVFIDGLAASIASLVAMAGDTVIMPTNAMMMVHNPWTLGLGDAEEFRKLADTLDHIREAMLAAYQGKTGKSREELMPILDAETWMTAEEAVEMGFADEIEDPIAMAASIVKPGVFNINGREFDLSRYKRLPDLPAGSAEDTVTPDDGSGVTVENLKVVASEENQTVTPGDLTIRARLLKMGTS